MISLDSENIQACSGYGQLPSVEAISPEFPDSEAKGDLYAPAFPVSTRAALTSVPRQPDQFSGDSRVRADKVPILYRYLGNTDFIILQGSTLFGGILHR